MTPNVSPHRDGTTVLPDPHGFSLVKSHFPPLSDTTRSRNRTYIHSGSLTDGDPRVGVYWVWYRFGDSRGGSGVGPGRDPGPGVGSGSGASAADSGVNVPGDPPPPRDPYFPSNLLPRSTPSRPLPVSLLPGPFVPPLLSTLGVSGSDRVRSGSGQDHGSTSSNRTTSSCGSSVSGYSSEK